MGEHRLSLGSDWTADPIPKFWENFLNSYGDQLDPRTQFEDLRTKYHAHSETDQTNTVWLIFKYEEDRLAFYFTYS